MNFNFESFSNKVENNAKKADKVKKSYGENYVLMVLINDLSVDDIDFTKFSEEDIWSVDENLDGVIASEADNGDVILNPGHPLMQMVSIGEKIYTLHKTPYQRSPFMFI